MIVNHKGLGLFGIGVRQNEPGKCRVLLKPGINEIEDADWDAVKDHPGIGLRLECGDLVIIKGSQGRTAEDTLAKIKPAEAAKMVGECIDLGILERWQAKEKRKDVLRWIQNRIALIKEPPKYRDKDGKQPESKGDGDGSDS